MNKKKDDLVSFLFSLLFDLLFQIETNRNTALTLACFQGRHEVVSLLVDRKANIEHRAKVIFMYWLFCVLFVNKEQK